MNLASHASAAVATENPADAPKATLYSGASALNQRYGVLIRCELHVYIFLTRNTHQMKEAFMMVVTILMETAFFSFV